MNSSIKLGNIAGIDIYLHWTFLLLLAWVGGSQYVAGASAWVAAANVLLVVAVFACVVAHEYGHALTARRYGIPTEDITLLPIGGVARLREMPSDPFQELIVAIMGPMVNVVIASLIAVVLFVTSAPLIPESITTEQFTALDFAQRLMLINIALVVFNAIPAFPMDGGRVLRALLAMQIDRVKATEIAATVGKALAFGLGLLGLYGNPLLILIAIFVYFGASAEATQVRIASVVGNLSVRAAMIANFRTVNGHDLVQTLRERLLEGMQQDFPVIDFEGNLIGVVYRSRAVQALGEDAGERRMRDIMKPLQEVSVSSATPLQEAMTKMQELHVTTLAVVDDGDLVGLLTQENIAELIMFRENDPGYASDRGKTAEERPVLR
jgi:Zn-dependent protease